ncbi:hypothetical protein ACOMHN_010983 [Nucella lapillus]
MEEKGEEEHKEEEEEEEKEEEEEEEEERKYRNLAPQPFDEALSETDAIASSAFALRQEEEEVGGFARRKGGLLCPGPVVLQGNHFLPASLPDCKTALVLAS